ncbi:MAG: tRNA guanosine(34) transglycosylase Tgt [Patescibacteria group bacterium]
MSFKVLVSDSQSRARTGIIKTAHGDVKTPCFIPDATYGAVKHLSSEELQSLGLQMLLGNIYHLGIRPGTKLIKKMGGLRKFMNWPGPILTDSGGWQVFSLVVKNGMGRVLEHGIEFQDHLSGAKHLLTPDRSIQMQLDVDSDIVMVLDYPVLPGTAEGANRYSVTLTTRWAKESNQYFLKQKESKDKMLMVIIQGANSKQLRQRSFEELEEAGPFAGYGFGGPPEDKEVLEFTARLIPDDRLRYLMGSGTPSEIVKAVAMGWDLFDCVVPTRNARHGLAYTFKGEVRVLQSQYQTDSGPIEKGCPCLACQNYSRSYIRHLLKVKEPLGQRLMTIHNLHFYMRLMEKIRTSIEKGEFKKLVKQF